LLSCLALLSKPAAVSLPLILLILDWYPLRRLTDRQSFLRLATEKLPFVFVTVVTAVLTVFAQQVAMQNAPVVDILSRLMVASKALLFYLAKTVWPSNLAAFYMHPGNVIDFALWEYLLYVVLATALALVVVAWWHERVWTALLLFYVVTLAPMLGLIQVGGQWAADRYSYLPSLGLALAWGAGVVWCVNRLRGAGHPVRAYALIVAAVVQLTGYTLVTLRQITFWRDTETLATRIIDLEPHKSGAAYYARAIYRNEQGRSELALADITEVMKISLRRQLKSTYPDVAMVQARILKDLGRIPEALVAAEWAIQACNGPPPDAFITFRDKLIRMNALGKDSSQVK
jgi:hypothetical protein